MPFDVLKDAIRTTVASYTPGSGSLTVAAGSASAFPAPSPSAPILITGIVLASYASYPETYGTYEATGCTGDTFTGLTLVSGVDTAFVVGDLIEMRVCAKHVNDLATALGASIITVGTEAALTGSRKLVQGTNVTFVDGGPGSTLTINATGGGGGGSGTVTSMSVVTANGFAGVVATATTTPAITLTTTATGVLKGSAGALVAAVPGTDFLITNQTVTLTGDTTGTGSTSITTSTTKIGGKAVTLGGALTLLGAFATTITVTGTTAVTLPPAGTLVNSAVVTLANLSLPSGQVTGLAASATTDTTNASNITTGTLSVNRFNSGTGASTSTYLRGDGSWVTPSASGGTPGGTNGQIQYNAGAFGGFTASGDATINTSTGAVSVTKTGGVAFAPSATLDTTIATNITSGTLPSAQLPSPSPIALGGVRSFTAPASKWLNAIQVSGMPTASQPAFSDISGSATLAQLPTIGANTFLGNQTGGTATPAALANIAANADGSVTFTPLAHSSPAVGDLWFPSSDQGTFAIGRASGPARLGGCIFSCGSCTPVANTAAATSIFGSPTGAVGSLTIPANTLVASNILRWRFTAKYSTSTTNQTLAVAVILNGSTVLSMASPATYANAAVTAFPSVCGLAADYTILSTGPSATGSGMMYMVTVGVAGVLAPSSVLTPGGATPVAATTFASNTPALFDIKVTWGSASVNNSFQITSFQLFLDN